MNKRMVLFPMIYLALVALLLVGCSTPVDRPTVVVIPSSTDTPSPVPPTYTPTPVPATYTPTASPLPDTVVNVQALHLRTGPGIVYDSIDVVRQGDELEVVGQAFTCDWLKVLTPGGTLGWVSGKPPYVIRNLNCSDIPLADIPPTPTPTPTDTPTPTATPTDTPVSPMPLVILMDRYLDFLNDNAEILAILPVEIKKEYTDPNWDRVEDIPMQDPALIVIHQSAFWGNDKNIDMKYFMNYMRNTPTKYLFYTGSKNGEGIFYDWLIGQFSWLNDENLYVLIDSHGTSWDKRLEDKVRDILELN